MSAGVIWALVASALLVVVVRRRAVAIALVGGQSLVLGVVALVHADAPGSVVVAAAILVVKGLVLPRALLGVAASTREPGQIGVERHPLGRLIAAVALALALVALVPRFGLESATAEHGAIALVALGIAVALLRRAALLQALGFLTAENGVYLAALAAPGGMPAVLELGLAFDVVVVVSVAAAFSAKIHEQLGTSDTSRLGGLRD